MITIYNKQTCPYCVKVKALLDGKGIAYTLIDVERVPGARDEMVAKGAKARTVPQVFSDDRYVGDCERLYELESQGILERELGLESAPAKNAVADSEGAAKVAIIGSGPAGLTAAIYAARANLAPLVFSGMEPGGQLTITSDVENYPGFANGVNGPELMVAMREQALRFGTAFVDAEVDEVALAANPKIIRCGGSAYRAETVIIATGASAKWLGIESEKRYSGKGVSACATCDGFFFKGEDVCVVGGGDTALEEALYLTNFARSVTVIHRRDEFRASKIMRERVLKHPKIKVEWNSIVDEIVGDDVRVTSIVLKDVKTSATKSVAISGVFIAIGHKPNTELFKGQLELNPAGYLVVPNEGRTATALAGVYAAGDVRDPYYRQAVTAAGMGCMAAIEAERFLAERS